jgi:hypothetical protein
MITTKKSSLLHNLRGEPDQLLIIQWFGSIFLTIAISWNAAVDAYLGQELVYAEDGTVTARDTRFNQIGVDTLLFLVAMSGGAGSLYNWRRAQDRKYEVEKVKVQATAPIPPPMPSSGMYIRQRRDQLPPSKDPLDNPGDPDARL